MDEKTILRLRVLERTEQMLNDVVEEQVKPKMVHPNQTNPLARPIYKNLMKFHNAEMTGMVGEKFSVKDLLR